MAFSYLNSFRSSLSSTQGNQLLKLLTSKRGSGAIRTVDEFTTELKTLTTAILAVQNSPTFKFYQAIAGQDISSEQYNVMLTAIHNDLETIFTEANNIEEILNDHNALIEDVAMSTLRGSLAELDTQVSLFEFIAKSGQGFDDAISFSFSSPQTQSTTRTSANAGLVFVDPRKNASVPATEDCIIDILGQRLVMGATDINLFEIRSVDWLSNSNSIRGEIDASFKNSNLNNLIDGLNNTYWIIPILLSAIKSDGVGLELSLSLGAARDVNYVEIELATLYPLKLLGIDYIDGTGIRQTSEAGETLLTRDNRINFNRVNTGNLILRFRQDNYEEVQFTKGQGQNNYYRAVQGQALNTPDLSAASDDLRQVLSSDFLLSNIYGLSNSSLPLVRYYEYDIGFDNIRVGIDSYNSRSIYASTGKKIDSLGQLGLRVTETRPQQILGTSTIVPAPFLYPERTTDNDNIFYHGVVEYWAVIQSYSVSDTLIATDTLPLTPLNAQRVYHEQLVFRYTSSSSPRPDISRTMFFTDANISDVSVYRNGTLLSYASDWVFVPEADSSDATVTIPNSRVPMGRGIQVFAAPGSPLDIFTVSYTPAVSSTAGQVIGNLLTIVDLTGDLFARRMTAGTILLGTLRYGIPVAYCNCFLVIIMRQNSSEDNFSASVENYLLATGTINDQKYSGV